MQIYANFSLTRKMAFKHGRQEIRMRRCVVTVAALGSRVVEMWIGFMDGFPTGSM